MPAGVYVPFPLWELALHTGLELVGVLVVGDEVVSVV